MIKKVIATTALMAFGVVAALGNSALAQSNRLTTEQNPTNRPANRSNSSQLSSFDTQFMAQAAQSNMAEVALSQLALRRASSNEVKQYAQRMIRDHWQANTRLAQLARQKRVTLPTQLDAKHQAIRSQLEQLSGERFDQEYMRAMENDHAQATALFQSGAQQAQDRDVKAFASNTLPKIQGHLQMARTMTGNTSAQNQNSPQR
jgi:putative membrane protein